jgi:hypothetical protein
MALIRDQAAAKKRPSSRAGQPPQPVGLRDFFVGKTKRGKHRDTGDAEGEENGKWECGMGSAECRMRREELGVRCRARRGSPDTAESASTVRTNSLPLP